MTRNRSVETVVMKKNVQKSQRSIVSANIFHSLRIWSSRFWMSSFSSSPLTTRTRSSSSTSPSPSRPLLPDDLEGKSTILMSSLGPSGSETPDTPGTPDTPMKPSSSSLCDIVFGTEFGESGWEWGDLKKGSRFSEGLSSVDGDDEYVSWSYCL